MGQTVTALNQESLKALKELSRICCSEEEDRSLLDGLSKILGHVEKLQGIDTEGVTPTDTVFQGETIDNFRDDVVEKTLDRKIFLDNAPDQVGGMVRTPQVIETQEA